jgi:hypothetical protein
MNVKPKKEANAYYTGTKLDITGGILSEGGKRMVLNYEGVHKEGDKWVDETRLSGKAIPSGKFVVSTYRHTGSTPVYIGYMEKDPERQHFKMLPEHLSLDTGGYTGSWGSEGKWALLHQKEIVLNADDTANFLASLEVLRDIINVIDLHAMSA